MYNITSISSINMFCILYIQLCDLIILFIYYGESYLISKSIPYWLCHIGCFCAIDSVALQTYEDIMCITNHYPHSVICHWILIL